MKQNQKWKIIHTVSERKIREPCASAYIRIAS